MNSLHIPDSGWLSYGRNLRKRGFRLRLYLTKNPVIDQDIIAGYQDAESKEKLVQARKPEEPPQDLFGFKTRPRRS